VTVPIGVIGDAGTPARKKGERLISADMAEALLDERL